PHSHETLKSAPSSPVPDSAEPPVLYGRPLRWGPRDRAVIRVPDSVQSGTGEPSCLRPHRYAARANPTVYADGPFRGAGETVPKSGCLTQFSLAPANLAVYGRTDVRRGRTPLFTTA